MLKKLFKHWLAKKAQCLRVDDFLRERDRQRVIYSACFTFPRQFGRRRDQFPFFVNHLWQVIQGKATWRDRPWQISQRVWFSVPLKWAADTHFHDAFFVVAVVLAHRLNQNLDFCGSVSQEVTAKVEDLEEYYRFENEPRKISIFCKINQEKIVSKTTGKMAQFFSLGVDSFYTLAKLRPQELSPALLFVDGYDVPLTNTAFLDTLHRKIRKVGKEMRCETLFLQSNLRDLADPIMNWGQFHGVALAAAAFLVPFSKIAISGESFDWPDWGLQFGLDELFSTKERQFQLVGHAMTREKKVRFLKNSPLFSVFCENVRVCWKNVQTVPTLYNCSTCQKCLRTLLILQAVGITETPTFTKLNKQDLAKVEMVGHVREEWTILYTLLSQNKKKHQEILSILRQVLRKPMRG